MIYTMIALLSALALVVFCAICGWTLGAWFAPIAAPSN
jgi:hypothetical protein